MSIDDQNQVVQVPEFPHRSMKDSGIQWIGTIPKTWNLATIKSITTGNPDDIVDGPFGSDMKVSDYVDEGVPIIQLTNIKAFTHNMSRFRFVSEDKADELQRHNAYPGDVIVAKMMPAGRSMIVADDYPRYVLSSDSIRIKVSSAHSRMFLCACLNSYLMSMYDANSTGSTRLRINTNDVRKSIIALPCEQDEETKIASYLYLQCGIFDRLTGALDAIVEKLEELKISTIYGTITKGLNPSIQLKESYVSWIGQIPASWEVRPLKSMFVINKRIAGSLGYDVLSITQKGIKIKDIVSNEGQQSNDYSKYQIVKPGDFAMNHMDLLTGFVDLSTILGVTSPDYRVFTPISKDIDSRFALYIFQIAYKAKIFYGLGQGVSTFGRWRLPKDQFLNFLIPVPPLNEQRKIVEYLDNVCSSINILIELLDKKLDLLVRLRDSSTYECVTGKKQICKEVSS